MEPTGVETEIKEKISFMDEIRQQPEALRRFIANAFEEEKLQQALLKLIDKRKDLRVVLTGMGSSLFGCYITMNFLRSRGISATTIEAYELQMMGEAFFTKDTILVAVSQSGESPEVLELLEDLPSHIPVIVVTNYPNSHLYGMTELAGGIYAGAEFRTSTKTYTNTLAAMLLLGYRIAGCGQEEFLELKEKMERCAGQMEEIISHKEIGREIAAFISDIDFLICVGSGFSYTTACHSEIVAEEAGKFYASRFTPAQFIHGPIELIHPGFGTILYDFDPSYSEKCDQVRESVLKYGGKVLMITNRHDVKRQENQMVYVIDYEDPATATLLEILPLELGINSLCKLRGVSAGQLSRVVKRIAM